MFLLLTYWIITGITAEDVTGVYYQLENSSVCLHVKHPPPHFGAHWLLPGTGPKRDGVSEKGMNSTLKNKVDYDSENNSLCIKNLTNADSGIYEFNFIDSFSYINEKYRIIVQGQVPRPVVVMSELDTNTSAGMCNISVNCSIRSEWLWSFCDADACRTAQASLSEVNISISIGISITGNRTVVCSGNNRVSTKSVFRRIPSTCHSHFKKPEPKDPDQQLLLTLLVIAVCLFLLVFIVFITKKLLLLKLDQTSTTHLIENQQAESPTQREPRVSTSSSVAYENVDAIHPSETSGTREEPGSTHGPAVNTVYSVLQPTKRKPSQGTGDDCKVSTGPQEAQVASASQGEQPLQVDTVYSMLQRPRHKQ
ncbi:uncharacterized protein si:ch1073-220m6.1 [Betta splendens]|uniref:Uncharacterized protein si:ch1073-220m6.1 n=1 Tax=Betta splendens TaxID=158456 RepID=A0A6P7LL12_BETSP|nr:uncharacterized protein si:ch1073-220m6.1 [Betta splendens]